MRIVLEPASPIAHAFGLSDETVRVVRFSKSDIAALAKAAAILEALRETWDGDDNHPSDTDVALAAYTMRDLIEEPAEVYL